MLPRRRPLCPRPSPGHLLRVPGRFLQPNRSLPARRPRPPPNNRPEGLKPPPLPNPGPVNYQFTAVPWTRGAEGVRARWADLRPEWDPADTPAVPSANGRLNFPGTITAIKAPFRPLRAQTRIGGVAPQFPAAAPAINIRGPLFFPARLPRPITLRPTYHGRIQGPPNVPLPRPAPPPMSR